MTVKVVTDSTSYIDPAIRNELDIRVVNLSVHFSDESFDETAVDYDYFYNKIDKDKVIPTSSQPATGDIYQRFREIVSEGHEAVGIFLSAKMSGTYDSALIAKKMLLEEFPEAKIEIIDSKTNSMALGVQVIEAAQAARDGQDIKEVAAVAEYFRERVHFYFVPASLNYLIKGGRIGGASALIGSFLHIRPILYVNDGMTDVFDKVRGTARAVKRMMLILEEDAKKYTIKHLLVHHINAEKYGQELAHKLSQQYNRKVSAIPLGPAIGLHVGPGTVGIIYTTE